MSTEKAAFKEIKRLERLLNERKNEYEMFGKTPNDEQKDLEIRNKIIDLKRRSV